VSNAYQASQADNGWQQFAQLVGAVNAGDVPAAQKAYASFTQSTAAAVARANPVSRIARALNEIGPALQARDVGKAQQALASLRPPGRSARGAGDMAAGTSAPSIVPANPDTPGTKLNLTL